MATTGPGTTPSPRAEADSPPAGELTGRVWTVPNLLSMLRLGLVPVFAYLIVAEHDGWAILVLMVSGFTDWLDGYLARRWSQISRVGVLLDPAADRLYILSTLLGLAYRDIIPVELAAAIIGRDVLLAGLVPVLARYGYGPLPVHYLGKAATFNLLYAFPLILLGQGDSVLARVAEPVGWAFAWWGTGLYWWAGLLYVRQVYGIVRTGDRAPEPR